MLAERNVRDEHIRYILNRAIIALRKAFPILVRLHQRPRLIEQRLAIRSRRLIGREQLIDLYDKPRKRVQPRKPGIVQHETEQSTTALDAPLFSLVSNL